MSLINYLVKLVECNRILERKLDKLEDQLELVLQHQQRQREREIAELTLLGDIERAVVIPPVASFLITQQGESDMPVTGIQAGSSGTFVATPLDASGATIPLPAGFTLGSWASSDTTNTSAVISADGLSVVVTVNPADPNASFDLSISGANADGSQAAGKVTVPVTPAPPPPPPTVASFRIDQTA